MNQPAPAMRHLVSAWRDRLAAAWSSVALRTALRRVRVIALHTLGITSIAATPLLLYNVDIPGEAHEQSNAERALAGSLVVVASILFWWYGFDARKLFARNGGSAAPALAVAERRELAEVLQSEVGADELSAVLRFRSGRDISLHLTDTAQWASRVVDAASAGGWLETLIESARSARPDVAKLEQVRLFAGVGLVVPERRALDRIVNASQQFHDLEQFISVLTGIESAVCRIACRLPDNKVAFGTGFLIGPDLLLTNHHVVAQVINDPQALSRVECLFDFRMQDGFEARGSRCRLAENPILLWSPAADYDEGRSTTPPTADELDFAVLRLGKPMGELPLRQQGSASSRRWLELPGERPDYGKSDAIFILQHPSGETKKLTLGSATDVQATRIRYSANSRGGSSGSPCLNANLELCALHHAGDPDFERYARFNQGIPIELIAAKVQPRLKAWTAAANAAGKST